MTESEASDLYGTFIAFVFLTPFLGGLLADRIFGYRKSIIAGGILMGIGYCLMAVPGINYLYIAMFLVIMGNGFFKPNISTLLGALYTKPEFKARKDAGYNIFYMGINVGAFICNFFGAAMENWLGWSYAFLTAGIGMFIGIIVFLLGNKHYKDVDVLKPAKQGDMSTVKIFGFILLPSIIFGLIGYYWPMMVSKLIGHPVRPLVGSNSTDAFLFGCIPVVLFYGSLFFRAKTEEKKPIGAMLIIFAVVVAFWAVFKQNGSTLNNWADKFQDREIPAAIVPTCNVLYLSKTITTELDTFPKYDAQFRVTKDENGKVVQEITHHPYLKNLPKEKWPKEGEKLYVFSTSLFQSVNPGWVILLTPLVVAFFAFLGRRGREPSTPIKIAWGVVITALSTLVMVAAVKVCGNGAVKASAWWFIMSYGVITIGELFLSPMGLSLVSKLSPPRITSLMMGGWFLATSIGNKLSGVLSSLWDSYEDKANFFWVNFALLTVAALVIILMLRWLNKVFKEYSA